jgi:CdiI immunity protein
MDAGKFPWFANLYSAYFHEDWRFDETTSDDVIRRYMEFQPPEEVAALKAEMEALVATNLSEAELDRVLGPFISFRPVEDGMTIREWVEHLLAVIHEGETS